MIPSRIVAKKGFSTPLMTTASVTGPAPVRGPRPPAPHPTAPSKRKDAPARAEPGVTSDRRRPQGTAATLDGFEGRAAVERHGLVVAATDRGRRTAVRRWLSRHEPNHRQRSPVG